MRTSITALLIVFILTGACIAQVIPPVNLSAELLQAGQVALTWDAPPDGLVEDFEDDIAQGFEWAVYEGSYVLEDGMAKIDVADNNFPNWGSGAYTDLEFDNFTVSVTFEYVSGDASRGLLFRGNGPKDDDYAGYGFWIAHTLDGFSMWKYFNGDPVGIVPWTVCPEINEGPGATNTLSLTAVGVTLDMYVNGTYVGSVADGDHPIGTVGIVTAYGNEVWFDDITSFFVAPGSPPVQPPQFGTPVAGFYNDLGQPVEERFAPFTDAVVFDRSNDEPYTDELDEFIEYRIYRDGIQIGTSDIESYTDQLQGLGEFEYTVTAFYDEGESGHAGPVLVNWEAVILDLVGQVTVVPPEGGFVYYDATLINTLPQTFRNIDYWTMVRFPNGQELGPVYFRPIIIPGFINITVVAMYQEIPAEAEAGIYTLTGHIGPYPASMLSDSFEFEKLGAGVDGYRFDPEDWTAGGSFELVGDPAEDEKITVLLPDKFMFTGTYPNPFNAMTTVSIAMPEAANLTVRVYNISGQQVATLIDGRVSAGQHSFVFDGHDLASGLYFIRANVPGQIDELRKITLLR